MRSPNGATAYVANAGASSVTVISTATNTVVTTLAVGFIPADVVITPMARRLMSPTPVRIRSL
jgi:YVTN family beta-propeller protein